MIKHDNFNAIVITIVLLTMMAMQSCSTSKGTYTPKKLNNKSLTVCNSIGCYAKR